MKVYRISKEKMGELRPSLMNRIAVVLALIFAASFFISLYSSKEQTDLRTMLIMVAFLGATATFAVFNAVKKLRARLDEMESSFELVWEAGSLTRRQRNLPEVTMDYSEIRQIEEVGGQWLKIRAEAPQRFIGIPVAVENYEDLKADLALITGVEIRTKSSSSVLVWRYLPVILVIGLMAVSVMAPNKLVAAGASFLLAAVVVAAVIIGYRSPNVPKDMKRGLLISLIVVIVLLGRGFLLLRR